VGGTLRFTKMHGLGNDYVFIDGFREAVPADHLLPELVRKMSDRHFGVGSDGLILILPSEKADFRMRMFNADGSEAEMCGNGIRCFAKYVYQRGLTRKTSFSIETGAGILQPQVILEGDGGGQVKAVKVDMGRPRFKKEEIPMVGPSGERALEETLKVDGQEVKVSAVSMGNPHCVVFVPDVTKAPLELLGPKLENHPSFPNRTNVEFVQVHDPGEITMRVWERGSGVTLACGTGACASVVVAASLGLTEREVTVHLDGGDLKVEWADDGRVYLTGPAEEVFDGAYFEDHRTN